MKYKCVRCNTVWNDTQKNGYKLGWRFQGKSSVFGYLCYCPMHKQFQHSLADRDQ